MNGYKRSSELIVGAATKSKSFVIVPLLALMVLFIEALNPAFAADTPRALDGQLAWAAVARLSSPVSGVVAQVLVHPGQQVKQGAVMLRLDRTPFADRLAAAVAARSGLLRAAAEAKRDAERVQQLYDRTVASESERQVALIKQEQAEAQLNEARAKVKLRQWELGRTTLTAPYSARVLRVETAVGETVSSKLKAPVLLRIAPADHMLAVANASADVAAQLSLGQKMNVLVGQPGVETRVQGTLVGIVSPVVSQVVSSAHKNQDDTVNYQLQVQIKPQKDWIAGLPAKIELSD